MNEIAINSNNFTLQPTGIEFHGNLSREEWNTLGEKLASVGKSIGFMIGDWINYGEKQWGEMYDEIQQRTGLDYGTLSNFVYVAKRVQFSLRNEKLDWSHHAVVAKVKTPEEQSKWLSIAEKEKMSVRRLRRSVAANRIVSVKEMGEDKSDMGTSTYMTWLNKLGQWWRQRTQTDPVTDWEEADRARLKRDLEPIVRIYELL